MLRAAKLFEPWNGGVLTNSRTHLCHEDARTVLKLSAQKYDDAKTTCNKYLQLEPSGAHSEEVKAFLTQMGQK